MGDLDGDGKPDVVVNCIDAPAAVLRNVCDGNQFLVLDIIDKAGRPAVGARVEVRAGGHRQVNNVMAGGSYLSSAQRLDCFSGWVVRNRWSGST